MKIALQKVILKLETAESLSEIHNLEKLKGHPIAWRIRIGDYRLGLFAENQVLELVAKEFQTDTDTLLFSIYADLSAQQKLVSFECHSSFCCN